eukprot:gene3251-13274_t
MNAQQKPRRGSGSMGEAARGNGGQLIEVYVVLGVYRSIERKDCKPRGVWFPRFPLDRQLATGMVRSKGSASVPETNKGGQKRKLDPHTQPKDALKVVLPKILPKQELEVKALYPNECPTIFEVPGLLFANECAALLKSLETAHTLTRTAHAASKTYAWRDVDRYSPSQGFGPHYDEEDEDPLTNTRSLFTLLLYMTDVPVGGETVFYKSKGREVLAVKPVQGMALLHAQGAQCLLHEGRPVGGNAQKWVLRSDVMVSRTPDA